MFRPGQRVGITGYAEDCDGFIVKVIAWRADSRWYECECIKPHPTITSWHVGRRLVFVPRHLVLVGGGGFLDWARTKGK